jgi:hypothetical protein
MIKYQILPILKEEYRDNKFKMIVRFAKTQSGETSLLPNLIYMIQKVYFTSIAIFLSLMCSAQLRSTLSKNGFAFPVVKLNSTTDTVGLGNPKIGQMVYNENVNMTGFGADKSGYYAWQNNSWHKVNSTMPSGTIVLSNSVSNPTLEQKGFIYLNEIQLNTNPFQNLYLFIKR